MPGRCVLILGGARSGKSAMAQKMAGKAGQKVLFVATAQPLDEEMGARIQAHKENRPPQWRTLEAASGIGDEISRFLGDSQVVIIDCVTVLVSNVMFGDEGVLTGTPGTAEDGAAEQRVTSEIEGIVRCMNEAEAQFIIVSNEVGMGLVPVHESDEGGQAGRMYRDLLGKANQMLARRADEMYLMVAGIPWRIKGGSDGQDS